MDVVVVARRPVGGNAFLDGFLTLGQSRGHRVRALDKGEFLRSSLRHVDVVCLKSHLDDDRVWQRIADAGVRAVNRRLPWSHRSELEAVARVAGVPTPRSAAAASEVAELSYPVVRKSRSLLADSDATVLEAPPARPDCGRYFYQELVPRGGLTSKAYCIGAEAFLVQELDARAGPGPARRPAVIPGSLADAARAVGRATGLEVYGVDFVGRGEDQFLVDVNPFPSFRHVSRAPEALWSHLEGTTRRHA